MNSDILLKIVKGETVSSEQMEKMPEIMISEESNNSLKAAFLASLAARSLSPQEVSGFAKGLKKLSHLKPVPGCTDIVGTGGDKKNTINVSTAASILCSSMGIRIAKHGNIHITSRSGGADFMEGTGYTFPLQQDQVMKQLDEHNFAFILASKCNNTFRDFSEVRRFLGIRTIFNMMGPITNPINPERMVLGCPDEETQNLFVEIMNHDNKNGIVVRGEDGMDEISYEGKSFLTFTGNKPQQSIDFKEVTGIRVDEDSVTGKTREEVFMKNLEGLSGKNREASAFIAINAAPAIILNRPELGFQNAYELALKQILSGKAISHLNSITEHRSQEVMSHVR